MHSPRGFALARVGFAALAASLILPRPARADDAVGPERGYRLIRDEENWAWLRDALPTVVKFTKADREESPTRPGAALWCT